MNKVVTTDAGPTAGQPIIANAGDGTLPFIQDGIKEAIWNALVGIMGGYTTNDLIILSGVVVTLSNSNNTATWTAGSIGYNGEVYTVDAGNVTKTGGQAFVYQIATTYSGTLDPVIFSDTSSHSVHQVNKITFLAGASSSGIADFLATSVKPLTASANSGFSISVQANTTGATIRKINARKTGGRVIVSGQITATITVGTGTSFEIRISVPDAIKMKLSSSGNILTGSLQVYKSGSLYTYNTPIDYNNSFNIYVRIFTGNLISIFSPDGLSLSNGDVIGIEFNMEGDAL